MMIISRITPPTTPPTTTPVLTAQDNNTRNLLSMYGMQSNYPERFHLGYLHYYAIKTWKEAKLRYQRLHFSTTDLLHDRDLSVVMRCWYPYTWGRGHSMCRSSYNKSSFVHPFCSLCHMSASPQHQRSC